jgi:hypothetical protein
MMLLAGFTRGAEPAAPPSLGEYVPGDVWVYVRGTHVPSREFLREPSRRVWAALRESGIDEELSRLISVNLPPEDRDAFQRNWNDITATMRQIDWHGLLADENVFAERFGGLLPEVFAIFRPAAATRDANVAALAKLFKQFADLAGADAVYKEDKREGTSIWTLESANSPVGVYLLHKDDIVALTTGRRAVDDVVALLAGKAKSPSIERNERYRKALKQVPPAEFSTVFVDVAGLFGILPKLPDMVMGEKAAGAAPANVDTGRKLFASAIEQCNFIDYVISTGQMQGQREVYRSYTQFRPEAAEKPFRRMLTERTAFEDVHRYVPVEASGFKASTFIDLRVLYGAVLQFVRTEVPEGAGLCEAWGKKQDEWSFHVEDDVLSWLSGEFISVSIPPAPTAVSPGGDAVLLVRVRDREKALSKLRAGLERGAKFLTANGQYVTISKPTQLSPEQFMKVSHPLMLMAQCDPCVGVWEDWLIVGTREHAVKMVIDTASRQHASIVENPRYRSEGLRAEGPLYGASFADLSNLGQELEAAMVGMGFASAMLPDEPETRVVKAVINSLGRLGPVVAQLNYFSTYSTQTTYEANGFRQTAVLTYKPISTSTAER